MADILTRTGPDGSRKDVDVTRTLSEHERVLAWRMLSLLDAGYSTENAGALAASTYVDLHEACELLKTGCPEYTATKILL